MPKFWLYYLVIEQNWGLGFWEEVAQFPCNYAGDPKDEQKVKKEYKEYQRTGWATRKRFKQVKNPLLTNNAK